MKKSFLVIGAGEVGLAMLKSLYDYQEKHKENLRIATLVQPTPEGITQVKNNPGFADLTVEEFDLITESVEILAEVFKKYDTVICCSGFSAGSGMQVKVTKAVLAAGVSIYVPWQYGADYDMIGRGSAQPTFDEQLDVRDMLRAQKNTHWVIVSSGLITSFLFREDFGVVNLSGRKVNALGDWSNTLTLTTCEDIGKMTIKILFHQPALLDQVVFIAGDTLTFEQITNKLEQFFGVPFERSLLDVARLEQDIKNEPDNVFNRYRMVFTHPGVTWPMSRTFNAKQGIPTISMEQWLKANIPVID